MAQALRLLAALAVLVAPRALFASFNLDDAFYGLQRQQVQNRFNNISDELAALAVFRSSQPATPVEHGTRIGTNVTFSSIRNPADFSAVGYGTGDLVLTRLFVTLGLVSTDLGFLLGKLPDTGLAVVGVEAHHAFLPGGAVTPAFSVNLGLTRTLGVDEMSLTTFNGELSLSKVIGLPFFSFLEPYANLGLVHYHSELFTGKVASIDNLIIGDRQQALLKYTLGVNITAGALIEGGLSYDQIGENQSLTLHLGVDI